ncbi:MAG: HAD family hydrolase [Pseudomonadales bacterium]|nr:HAD family hydrolase [Pseudomonadales bacterium]
MSEPLRARFARVRLLCLDVDGVLTDGGLHYTESGEEAKTFSTQDGQAIKMLAASGVTVAIITGRRTRLVARRAEELGIEHLFQGVHDKREALTELLACTGLDAADAAHMGDDIPDLPVLTAVGLALAPANLHPALRAHVHHVTAARGGDGAVREACELLMRARGSWEDALAPYLRGGSGP